MTVEVHGDVGQLALGKIVNCHGAGVCPLYDVPESARQAEFAKATGIWCPSRARELFERVMQDHDFTVPSLKAAWQANSLIWDSDRGQLVVQAHWFEAVAGIAFVLLMLGYYILQGAQILFSEVNPWRGLGGFVAATLIYGGMAWIAVRFVITPNRVALRIGRVLAGDPALAEVTSSALLGRALRAFRRIGRADIPPGPG